MFDVFACIPPLDNICCILSNAGTIHPGQNIVLDIPIAGHNNDDYSKRYIVPEIINTKDIACKIVFVHTEIVRTAHKEKAKQIGTSTVLGCKCHCYGAIVI